MEKMIVLYARIPEQLKIRLEYAAVRERCDMQDIVMAALQNYLDYLESTEKKDLDN